ncbi:hypothetical protein MTQ10_14110 [Streptomyces sp. XM83C]|uniref:DUF7848 domain-containing protein n=1 Tax=Streptomyces sp. XM83C TaxID=2929781 RepID=UPI001FFB1F2E|nr:hypothetical protein [Streptomyces sp. XM83C]MCK1820714.1 hypothetical protein [Streptomyces sp. XM83C]
MEEQTVREIPPPVPYAGCEECTSLALLRHEARQCGDGTTETDANVLMRRHQARAHRVGFQRLFRYVPYLIVQDASAEPEYEACCVSEDGADCGAGSGRFADPAPVEEWQRRHTQETRHARYRRTFADYAVLERVTPDS